MARPRRTALRSVSIVGCGHQRQPLPGASRLGSSPQLTHCSLPYDALRYSVCRPQAFPPAEVDKPINLPCLAQVESRQAIPRSPSREVAWKDKHDEASLHPPVQQPRYKLVLFSISQAAYSMPAILAAQTSRTSIKAEELTHYLLNRHFEQPLWREIQPSSVRESRR